MTPELIMILIENLENVSERWALKENNHKSTCTVPSSQDVREVLDAGLH